MKTLLTKDFAVLLALFSILMSAISQDLRINSLERQVKGLNQNIEQIIGILDRQRDVNASSLKLAGVVERMLRDQLERQ